MYKPVCSDSSWSWCRCWSWQYTFPIAPSDPSLPWRISLGSNNAVRSQPFCFVRPVILLALLCLGSTYDLLLTHTISSNGHNDMTYSNGLCTLSAFGLSHLRMSGLALFTTCESHLKPVLTSFCGHKLRFPRRLKIFPFCFYQHFLRQPILPLLVILHRRKSFSPVVWTQYVTVFAVGCSLVQYCSLCEAALLSFSST